MKEREVEIMKLNNCIFKRCITAMMLVSLFLSNAFSVNAFTIKDDGAVSYSLSDARKSLRIALIM